MKKDGVEVACTAHAYKILVEKPEGKMPIGKLGRRWEDIKMDVSEVVSVAWIGFKWLGIRTGGGTL
jgi:hypothetical protein